MTRFLNKVYDIVDKIGKPNFILIVFILFVLVITGLYTTFSMFTTSEGPTLVDGINTYKFILSTRNEENSVTISANSTKNLAITISNPEDIKLLYGIYYFSSDSLDDVNVGYISTSEHQSSGTIGAKQDYVVDCKVYNHSTSDVTIYFGVKYGFETGGDLTLETGKNWVVKGAMVRSVTNGKSTYYDSLTSAIVDASTTETTTITLLEDIKEDVITNENAVLYDTVIDFNEKTLDGVFYNLNTDSTITLKNGTVVNNTSDATTIKNFGTMTILSGTYINNAGLGHCIYNNGAMTIEDGLFQLTSEDTEAATIYNDTFSILDIEGGTIETTGWGIVNNDASTTINSMTINSTLRSDLLNLGDGMTIVKNSIFTGSGAIINNSGTVVVYTTLLHASVVGVVYSYEEGSSGDSREWRIYGETDGSCVTWTDNNGQDDLKWTIMSSFTDSYNTYLYCTIYKSDHNNESGAYTTHIYNSAKTVFYYGSGWMMP